MVLEQGIIFNIQRFSIHDGPGIRTTVFFKGCPLKCFWCHNPESWRKEKELIYHADRCTLCGLCLRECPEKLLNINLDGLLEKEDGCILCGECSKVCPEKAHEIVGEIYTTDRAMKEIEKDIIFYDESGGGVTFSGGEPLMQPSFLEALLRECKEKGIHTAVDTSGHTPLEIMEKIAPVTDLFLFDVKLVKAEEHRDYTGVDNRLISNNLSFLSQRSREIIIRIPIIPGINDSIERIEEFSLYLRRFTFKKICLLPYHQLGRDKFNSLKRVYRLKEVSSPTEERMTAIKKSLESFGFNTDIGG